MEVGPLRHWPPRILLLALVLTFPALAFTIGQSMPLINAGNISHPAPIVRPLFRYWLPDASVDASIVAADIEAAAAIGAGGIEFLPFYEYGGESGAIPKGANWSTYNFGTAPFRELFSAALEAHEKNGLRMDFSLGPNQGQGVPASPNDEGLQWDLVPFTAQVETNGSYFGQVPGWGTGELVALVSACVKSNRTITFETVGSVSLENVTYDEYILEESSLTDHTTDVSGEGIFTLSFDQPSHCLHHRLFSFYQKLSNNKNLEFPSNINSSIFDSGSYIVDHFDANGANTVIKFWEDHILTDKIRAQLQIAGNYVWEDSLEIKCNVSWTRSILSRFEDKYGYSIKKYLPLLTFQENAIGVQGTEPGAFNCLLDTESEGIEFVNAYRAILLEGYKEYLQTLKSWANNELGLRLSVQPVYGLPMDMQASIPFVDVPETESLSFFDSIDSYRQFVGPANLAGKQIISNELGAVKGSGYKYHLTELLFSANRGFSAGINRYVIHGQTYSGRYYETTWPGHTPFSYFISELWSPRQPVWDHGLLETLDYMGRIQYIQQSGISKVDIALYNKESATKIRTVYKFSDLIDGGWSYNYLAPENLELPTVIVEEAVLAPAGPAYKAFVIDSTANVSLEAVDSLQRLADCGLPLIFVGESPSFYPIANGTNSTLFDNKLSALQSSNNVYFAEEGHLATKLLEIGIYPKVAIATNGTWYATWTDLDTTGYAIVFSDLTASHGSVTISDTRIPYFLNPWTGQQTPVLLYEQNSTTTTVPLSLAGNQTIIISFNHPQECSDLPEYHITSAPAVLGSVFTHDGLSLHIAENLSGREAILSNGRKCLFDDISVPSPFALSNWSLTVEHWEKPSNITDGAAISAKRNTTHYFPSLESWPNVPALVNTSGVGYYTSVFKWPPPEISGNDTGFGAYITFSKVLHSIRVQVNGHRVPPLDITNAVANITPYLQAGENTVTAIVPTTMWNYLRTVLTELQTSGQTPIPLVLAEVFGMAISDPDESGLVGEVIITPFNSVNC